MFFFFLLQATLAVAELPSKTFELPSLTIEVEQPYLIRKQATNLTCSLSAGWSGASLQNVTWLLNGELIDVANSEGEFTSSSRVLIVVGGKTSSEGDYQCLSDVVNITLSNRQIVSTKLVSSPVKLRRARITKFDKISEHMVSVRQGEVARLPCAGMPDVIPGPPEICFEKEGSDSCFGEKDPVNSNFLSTSSGMQISMVQQAHHGNYFCVVKNEFTKQIRKSPKPVILVVHSTDDVALADDLPPAPNLIYPLKHATFEKPVIIDVVQGQDVLLECVFTNAKIYWMKHNDTTPKISLSDGDARVRQVWGNLRFKEVTQEDGGIYSCHGVSPLEENLNLEAGDHPKVFYHLVVHGPTNVNLTLNENPFDKSWELSCLATNLKYEIPMAFVNGTALVDAIEQMGIASSTNFFTNPINVTMKVKQTFSGSVQCISRPAMDEAEIYGAGLDRGVSQNIFVASTPQGMGELITQGPQNTTVFVGQDVMLPCLLLHRVKSKYWTKDGEYVKIYGNTKSGIIGSNTLKVTDVRLDDAGWYTCTVTGGDGNKRYSASAYLTVLPREATSVETTTEPFVIPKKDEHLELTNVNGFVTGTSVRLQWSVLGNVSAVAKISNFRIQLLRKDSNGSWIEADRVDSHVRATTIKDLIPDNQYQLRVILHREDGSSLASNETEWMTVQKPIGDVPPLTPTIDSISLLSESVAKMQWSHNALIPNAKARHFHIHYKSDRENASHQTKVDGNTNETEISGLQPDSKYTFTITAENHAGRSVPSAQMEFNTTVIAMGFFNLLDGITAPARNTIILSVAAFCIILLMILICCVVYCNVRTPKNKKPNGKFLDTSYRIFNEQKVHKSRIPDNDLFMNEEMDECSPLKIKSDDLGSLSSTKFAFNAHGGSTLPNVYGNLDEMAELDEPALPNDPTYVSAAKLLGNGIYGNTTTARCYSPDSGTSHEMIVPYNTGTMRGSMFNPSPLMTSSPQRVSAYKCPDSLLYSPAGTASSIADTSSSGVVVTRSCESPTHPQTDGSDQGIRCGGSSRNSQVSSTDGSRVPAMSTFKSGNTTSFIASTLDRRTLREQISE